MSIVTDEFDVFVSYRHADAPVVRRFVRALHEVGVRTWIDDRYIEMFESITERIRDGLARSKALVAWYSTQYVDSRACQWELTAAYLAAQRVGRAPQERVLVINPEKTHGHIKPVELSDAKFAVPGESDSELQTLASAVLAQTALLDGPLGAGPLVTSPRMYGLDSTGYIRFTGRAVELWDVHSALWKGEHAITTGTYAGGRALLTGLGGLGKSLLAEEYALRFGAAYPGGIFWVRAYDNENSDSHNSASALNDQVRNFLDAPLGN